MTLRLPKRSRIIVAWLVLCGMASHAWIPQGFMPGSIANGTPIVICSGGFYKTVTLDEHGTQLAAGDKQPQNRHSQDGSSMCPFAAAATIGPAPSVLPIAVGMDSGIGSDVSDTDEFHSPFGPSRVQQSRAPPSFS